LKDKIATIAKTLRKKSTDAENVLWKQLRRKQLEGLKFRRQQPIDNYVVDFVCFEKRIVIEVDGGQHSIERDKDSERDNYLVINDELVKSHIPYVVHASTSSARTEYQ
jgi:very-short-patch-repair endonuclease